LRERRRRGMVVVVRVRVSRAMGWATLYLVGC
jgi:hypothetical protein